MLNNCSRFKSNLALWPPVQLTATICYTIFWQIPRTGVLTSMLEQMLTLIVAPIIVGLVLKLVDLWLKNQEYD